MAKQEDGDLGRKGLYHPGIPSVTGRERWAKAVVKGGPLDSFQIEEIQWPGKDDSKDQCGPMKNSKPGRKTKTITHNKRGIRWWENDLPPPPQKISSDQMMQSLSGSLQNMSELKRDIDERDG